LREVNGIYIFRRGGFVLKKQFFFFFGGFCFVHLPKDLFLWLSFLLSWDHRLFHFGFFPIFLSFFFPSIFSSISKRHFFPFFHPPLFYRNPQFFPFSIFFFLSNVSYRFFCRISWFYLFIYFYLFVHFLSFIFLFLFFSICRSIFSLSFDPFLGFARGTDGIARNKYKQARREQFISYIFENHLYILNYQSGRVSSSSVLIVNLRWQRRHSSNFWAIEEP
jgi:hypothetical protein